jgi:hypothetical protein
MRRVIYLLAILIIALLASAFTIPVAFGADFPRQLGYQGLITDAQGDPLTATGLSIRYFLYADSTGGSFLWAEVTQEDITDGLLAHNRGSSCPTCGIPDSVFLNNDTLWLEIQIDGEPIEPRSRLIAAPYSYRVASIDQATGGSISGDISISTTSSGYGLSVLQTGGGRAGYFQISNLSNQTAALTGYSNGLGSGGYFFNDAGNNALTGYTNGTATAILGESDYGTAVYGRSGSVSDGATAVHGQLYSTNPGAYSAAVRGESNGAGNLGIGVWGSHDGSGYGVYGTSVGGSAGFFVTSQGSAPALYARTDGTGNAGYFGGGDISIYDASSTETIELSPAEGSTGGQITLRKADGTTSIEIDAEYGIGGDGRITTEELEITGGSDLSEKFEIQSVGAAENPSPGMIVCIAPERPGELIVSSKAYDPAVAGVISGAGGVKPGVLMGQQGTMSDGQYAVALTGRVYCWADAAYGMIRPGDRLTTSATPGHAMKVTDNARAIGAVIGKAMTPLMEGRGLVLVLVQPQ